VKTFGAQGGVISSGYAYIESGFIGKELADDRFMFNFFAHAGKRNKASINKREFFIRLIESV